ncbi:hypothetical protein E2562_019706 [Oryza meyeriana var. granulata]|uniref:Uncharacterized protein n=1 Tax=Oryza meyeriana var. granulata TaxID=110450 RepID=A0A6G1C8V8_9ORYZ|nr:hypothetical protein E2562_019706 [Oryza meyeriana var. granulata]
MATSGDEQKRRGVAEVTQAMMARRRVARRSGTAPGAGARAARGGDGAQARQRSACGFGG